MWQKGQAVIYLYDKKSTHFLQALCLLEQRIIGHLLLRENF